MMYPQVKFSRVEYIYGSTSQARRELCESGHFFSLFLQAHSYNSTLNEHDYSVEVTREHIEKIPNIFKGFTKKHKDVQIPL